jgi:glycine/D-amino acid oxidase-like deaminating enzyme
MVKALYLASCLAIAAVSQDPGLPRKDPTVSYWQLPPNEHVADHKSHRLPEQADVIIIGSGITGTSVAWHLLRNSTSPPRIAMLEARQACSGATGRNGGHIRPSPYAEYAAAKNIFSNKEAAKITSLRVAHVEALISAAGELPEDGYLAAEARSVDSIDAFFDHEQWSSVKEQLETLKREVPELGRHLAKFGGQEARNVSLYSLFL